MKNKMRYRVINKNLFLRKNAKMSDYLFNVNELDEESGLYCYEARYYSDENIMFTARDPKFEKYFWMSPYNYCANNPVKYIDPTGMEGEVTDLVLADKTNGTNHTKQLSTSLSALILKSCFMKKMFLIFLLFLTPVFCHAQHEYDSIRCYSMMKFIVENESLIKSYMEIEGEEEYDTKKLHVIQNEIWKIFCRPPELNSKLYKYYKNVNENELNLEIRKDFVEYTFEESSFNKEILERMNNYLDSTLREGESIDTSNQYWAILFSDSFYNYGGVRIYNHNKRIPRNFARKLEIVFLFNDRNKIEMVKVCLFYGL